MVEKILVSPNRLRCYGNVISEHSLEDYELNKSILVKMTDTINGVLQTVYQFGYTLYGFIFGVDTGAKELYVQTENSGLLSFGLSNKSLYVETSNEDITCYKILKGFNCSNEVFISLYQDSNISAIFLNK